VPRQGIRSERDNPGRRRSLLVHHVAGAEQYAQRHGRSKRSPGRVLEPGDPGELCSHHGPGLTRFSAQTRGDVLDDVFGIPADAGEEPRRNRIEKEQADEVQPGAATALSQPRPLHWEDGCVNK
jgi:hypothetical protein